VIPKEFKRHEVAWRAQVEAIAASGFYADATRARRYIEKHIAPVWRPILCADDPAAPVDQILRMNDTMVMMLHLFARAYHRHGIGRSKTHLLECWLPLFDPFSDRILFLRAISKADTGLMIGRSKSAVERAIDRFRGKKVRDDFFYEKRLAWPSYIETGIMLDIATELQTSILLTYPEYAHAHAHAKDADLADAPTNFKQRVWCAEKLRNTEPVMDACGRAVENDNAQKTEASHAQEGGATPARAPAA
jgi:hypothetical protein